LATIRDGLTENTSVRADSFAEATAAATGKTSRAVRTIAARGKALGGALKDIAGTSLDSGVALAALAKKPKAERADLIKRAKDGEKVSARPALPAAHRLPE
jgi:hypothetical protein